MLDKMPANYQIIQFGLDGSRVSQQDLEYFNGKIKERNASSQLKWMREAKKEGVLESWIQIVDSLVNDTAKKHLVHLSINLESIQGIQGVSSNCLSGGIATEDAIQMVFEAGYRLGKVDRLTSVDISDYNPYVEDWQTGRFAATLFYYLVLGLSQGIIEKSKQ